MLKHNTICMFCHEKDKKTVKEQLLRIERLLQQVKRPGNAAEAGRGIYFLWDIHARCPYGSMCEDLDAYKSECMTIARRLEDKLITVATGADKAMYHETLRYLQGYFPAVYRLLERLHGRGGKVCE